MLARTPSKLDRLALPLSVVIILALIVWFAGWTGPQQPSAALDALWVLLISGPWAVGWLAASTGLGWPLRKLLLPRGGEWLPVQIALGVAAMLVLDATLGALGWLQIGGAIGAWMLVIVGLILLIIQIAAAARAGGPNHPPPWLIWTAAPSVGVLVVASCSAPGWLWASEFGGYDALSYHLQLPREWFALRQIKPLNHNVYSYLPGYMEAAYCHLAVLMGDPGKSLYACQFLHAAMALITAMLAYRFAAQFGGPVAGAIAACILLSTPWIIVVGSLGYNEMAVTMMLMAGLLVISQASLDPWRKGAAIGLLAGAACGAKLTATGMVALPLGVLLLLNVPRQRWLGMIAASAIAGVIGLMPFLIRNQLHSGNPVFPFASGVFGPGNWSVEQARIWSHGHVSDAGFGQRMMEFWDQFLRFGWGSNPSRQEPWKPQWSILPWLAIVGLALGMHSRLTRRWSLMLMLVLCIQIAFWLGFTHLKSRFMLPAAGPMAVAVTLGFAAVSKQRRLQASGVAPVLISIALVLLALVPVKIYRSEAGGAPAAAIGQAGTFSGDELSESKRREFGSATSASVAVNHLLPIGSKVLLIGQAAPLYFHLDRIAYQTTWDRGPLSEFMREFPDDPAAWSGALRDRGFTHLLIDETMLWIWQSSGWSDPLITPQRVMEFAGQFGSLEFQYSAGIKIYQLRN